MLLSAVIFGKNRFLVSNKDNHCSQIWCIYLIKLHITLTYIAILADLKLLILASAKIRCNI